MHMQRRFVPLLLAALMAASVPFHASAQDAGAWQSAIASPLRTDDDRKADDKRKPAEFLDFAQVKPGQKAFDVSTGGGSTAALLVAAVGPSGEVWAQSPKPNPKLDARLASHPAANLHAVVAPFADPIPKDTPPLDLIVINLNYHDIVNGGADRAAMNKRFHDALKAGGRLVIIDNAAKKGSGLTATKTLHRIDEDAVIEEVTRAGFKVDATSDYLHVASDPREQPFFEMKGAPDDKFAIRFVKK